MQEKLQDEADGGGEDQTRHNKADLRTKQKNKEPIKLKATKQIVHRKECKQN